MKHKLEKFVASALLAICASACGEWEYPEEGQTVVQAVPFESDPVFSTKVIEHKEANHYSVNLAWKAVTGAESYVLRRKDHRGTEIQIGPLGQNVLTYQDDSIESGQKYSYDLAVNLSHSLSYLGKSRVNIPLDLEVKGQMFNELLQITGIHRLFLAQGAELVTQGKDLVIDVDQIISDGGTIASFVEGQTGSSQVSGRAGGRLQIRAAEARGSLRVIARGENGGIGSSGSSGGRGSIGAGGSNGATAFEYNCFRTPGLAMLPGNRCSRIRYCSRQPGNGGRGGQGLPGGRGGNGASGGDSAHVEIEIAENSDFQVQYEILPGAGGIGGRGGPGGPGGPGGAPGSSPSPCGSAAAGPQGLNGAQGASGNSGKSGNAAKVCIKIGTVKFGDC